MDATRIREEIHEYLQNADDRFLTLIHGMVKADQAILGYKPDGTSITKEEMIARAERSERDISEGGVKTASQIWEEMKSW